MTTRLQKGADFLENILRDSIAANAIDESDIEQIQKIIDGFRSCDRTDLDKATWQSIILLTSGLKNAFALDAAFMLMEAKI